MLLHSLSGTALRMERDKVTAEALAQAKEALVGYATNASTPGQLPCPENTLSIGTPNEGQAQGACSNITPVIGRLPWRTLGLGPLRDGNGDLLWYVISPGFRSSPINSDTPAQLTVDGVANSAVAIIFSAGSAINGQARPLPTSASPPVVNQYLDLSNNDGDNTFITAGPADTYNDRLLTLSHDELFRVVEKRVAREVIMALNEYYCGFGNVNTAGTCIGAGGPRFYPLPADFTDGSCLGNGSLAACNSGASNKGRIPANPTTAWDATSLLRGTSGGNWFQSNGWRELAFYSVAPACTDGTTNCSGAGYLTLSPATGSPMANQKAVVIVAGRALSTTAPAQSRINKALLGNYLEAENLLPLDDIYTRGVSNPSTPFNDTAVSIP